MGTYGMAELLEDEGMEEMDFLENYVFESIVPGICPNCGQTAMYEPDQNRGWCDNCETSSIVSGLILAGMM